MRAVASSTRAAFSVHTNGRYRPVASAKPATRPAGSALGLSATAKAVPEVPIEMTTSPGSAPTPSAAAMLSPVPAASSAPAGVRPASSDGASTLGSFGTAPSAASSRSVR
jgi:hypothetical protein